jgi:excisionase family DNA binding protein
MIQLRTDTSHDDSDRSLSVNEYAAKLGVSRSSVYAEVRRKRLRLAKLGNRSLVTPTARKAHQQLLDSEADAAAAAPQDAA